jgi:TolB-like protein/DNA-binding winged helix-turn-helix (wHTH) protein
VQGDFRIGAWLIQPQLHTIARDGQVTHVEPKAMQVLVYLAEHPDQVVPKERLISAVWADTFVTDDVLTRCISELRKAFDDDAKNPQIIETIPRSGYRVVAPVGPSAPEERDTAAATKPQPRALLSRAGIGAAVGLLVLLAVAAVYWTRFSPRAHPQAGRIMLAVLPFQNLSGDPEQEYFSDGLTAEMISQLGRLPPERLGVIARTSAIQYKNTKKSAAEIGRELGVSYLLECTVQRSAGRVRIRAQLIQVSDQTSLWTASYDRDLRDVLVLEGDVAGAIAREIGLKFTPEQQASLAHSGSIDPEAHDAYLRGLNLMWTRPFPGREAGPKVVEYFQQAIARDPNYALAYVGLADWYVLDADIGEMDQRKAYPLIEAAALRAVQLDPRLGGAHRSLAAVREYYWDWRGAELEYRRAIALNPSDDHTHQWYSSYLISMGRFPEALAEARTAKELNPAFLTDQRQLADVFYMSRQYNDAVLVYKSILERSPNFSLRHRDLGLAYLQLGRQADAVSELEIAQALAEKSNDEVVDSVAYVYAITGRKQQALKILARLKSRSEREYVEPSRIAMVFAGLGDRDQAISWLSRAADERDSRVQFLKVNPTWDPLRSDPRFQALLRRIGLPE